MSRFETTKKICILLLQLQPISVLRQSWWWIVSSGKCHPAHTWLWNLPFPSKGPQCLSEPTPGITGWAVNRLQFRRGKEQLPLRILAKVVVFAIGGVWSRTVKWPPGLAGTFCSMVSIQEVSQPPEPRRDEEHQINIGAIWKVLLFGDVISSFVGIIWFMENVTFNYVSHLFVLFFCKDGLWFGKSTRWLTADVISCFPDIWINCP